MKPRLRVRQPGGAELVAEQPLDHQREAEGEEQPVQMVELVERLQHGALDQHAQGADGERRDEERPPVADPEPAQQEVGAEGAQHVLGAVREVDDVEQPEDHRQAERQQRVERAVDQADQQLAEQRRRRNAEDLGHARLT
jgi:hypothetical protein